MPNRPIVCLVLLLILLDLKAQHFTTDDVQLIEVVNSVFEDNHVDYQRLFPSISNRFSHSLISRLDPAAEFLLDSDTSAIHLLTKNFNLSSEATRSNLEGLWEIYSYRLRSFKTILQAIDQLDFFESDSILINLKQKNYAYDERSLELAWTRKLKRTVLEKYSQNSLLSQKSNVEINEYLNEKLLKVVEDEMCKVNTKLQDRELTRHVLHSYIRAFCRSFDPHSDFLSNKEEDDFISSLSSELYSTGINFSLTENRCIVSSVSAFSSASDHSKIRKGDDIIGVMIDGKMMSPLCLSHEVLNELFYGFTQDAATVELRSSLDGKYRVFELSKHPVRNTTNHIYSYLIQDQKTTVAHILFPSFYSPFSVGDNSSAQDLAIALLDAKKRNVDGIIIDLRGNGGGSVSEAVDFLGFFIDYGPLFTISDKENPSGKLQKDTKKGMLVDSKVMFLVNSLSASASEMVVSTMKKYPGSLIVGAQTFGKATGQVMIPVKTKYSKYAQGSVFVTSIKVFGFDGSNYQGVGVIPDIVLPTIYGKDMASELDYDYPLKHGLMRSFRPIKIRREPIDTLKIMSERRNTLSEIDSISQIVSGIINTPDYHSLRYDDFVNSFRILEMVDRKRIDDFDIQSLETNEAFINRSKGIEERSEGDRILFESFKIMADWIELTEN